MLAYRIELLAGMLAAITGLSVAAAVMVYGDAAWAGIVIGIGGLGAGIGALKHALGRGKAWLALLWVSSSVLLFMTILAIRSVGLLLVPGALGALVAAGVGTWRSFKQ